MGKQWSARLVINHELHDEIERRVKDLGPLEPRVRIAKWQSTLTQMISEMSEEQLEAYKLMAEDWRKRGPPKHIQQK